MGRGPGKLKMELISDLKARRKLFVKRKKTVEKSGKELSTLCGVDIGMIFVNSPHEATTTWSSGRNKRQQRQVLGGLVASFLSASSSIKTYTVSDCIKVKEKSRRKTSFGVSDFIKEKKTVKEDDDDEEEDKILDRAGLTAKMEAVRGRLNTLLSGQLVVHDESALQMVSLDCNSDQAMMMIEYNEPSP